MTKKELARLRELSNKMLYHLEDRVPGERQFMAVLKEVARHLGRVEVDPAKWGVK